MKRRSRGWPPHVVIAGPWSTPGMRTRCINHSIRQKLAREWPAISAFFSATREEDVDVIVNSKEQRQVSFCVQFKAQPSPLDQLNRCDSLFPSAQHIDTSDVYDIGQIVEMCSEKSTRAVDHSLLWVIHNGTGKVKLLNFYWNKSFAGQVMLRSC